MTELWNWLLGVSDLKQVPGSRTVLTWSALPPLWLLFLVIAPAALLLIFWLYRRERSDAGTAPRLLLALLRALVVALLLVMIFGPTLTVITPKTGKNYTILLVDASSSMGKIDRFRRPEPAANLARGLGWIEDPSEATEEHRRRLAEMTRLQIVQGTWAAQGPEFLDILRRRSLVVVCAFDGTIREIPPEGIATLPPAGTSTAIGKALEDVRARWTGQGINGVVLISDGKNNAETDPRLVAEDFGDRRIPIYAFAPGLYEPPRDLLVSDLEAPDAVFMGESMTLAFKLRALGLSGRPVRVEVCLVPAPEGARRPQSADEIEEAVRGSRRLTEQVVNAPAEGQALDVRQTVRPEPKGDYWLVVRADPRDEELTRENNYLVHPLRVAKDQAWVLLADHWPRRTFQFLRNAMVRGEFDDQGRLTHKILVKTFQTTADERFYQLHTRADEIEADDVEAREFFSRPLTAFPQEMDELQKYDVLVLGDVPLRVLGGETVARNIKEWVFEHGGGLILEAGKFFNPMTYGTSVLQEVLPVIPPERTVRAGPRRYDRPLEYRLTREGERHPITQMLPLPEHSLVAWQGGNESIRGLAPIFAYTAIEPDRVKPLAHVLANVRDPADPGVERPLVVTMHYGRGRVVFVSSDGTWRWRYLTGDDPYFYPFWRRAVRWAREGRLLGGARVRIEIADTRFPVGQPIEIAARAWDEQWNPRTDEELRVYMEGPSGDQTELALPLEAGRPGSYRAQLRPGERGPYRLWSAEDPERHYTNFEVFLPSREDEEPIIDTPVLQEIAARSGGQAATIDRLVELAPDIHAESYHREDRSRPIALWAAPFSYLLFAVLLTMEWVLRKVFRML